MQRMKKARRKKNEPRYDLDDVVALCEAVRRHYLGLKGGGFDVLEEATFFLEWHYSNCEGMGVGG